MKGHEIFLLVFLLGIFTKLSVSDPPPCNGIAIEGSPYTFSFLYTLPIQLLQLKSGDTNNQQTVLDCSSSSCISLHDEYEASIIQDNPVIPNRYDVNITIKNVNRKTHATAWIMTTQQGEYECILKVYTPIPKPECGPIEYTRGGTKLLWACTVRNVYPETSCQVEYRENNGNYSMLFASISTETGRPVGHPVFYDVNTCTITVPISFLKSDAKYQLRVNMYPPKHFHLANSMESKQFVIANDDKVVFTNSTHLSKCSETDNSTAVSTVIGIMACICILFGVACYFIGMKVERRRTRKQSTKKGAPIPMTIAQQSNPAVRHSGPEDYDVLHRSVRAGNNQNNAQSEPNRTTYEALAIEDRGDTPIIPINGPPGAANEYNERRKEEIYDVVDGDEGYLVPKDSYVELEDYNKSYA